MTARTGTAPTIAERWRSWTPYLLSVLRIIAAFLFIQFGTAKLYGFPAPIMPGGGTAPFGSLVWWASVFETFGGSLLLVGLYTRPVAFLLSGEMAVAYFKGHAPQGFWPVLNQGASGDACSVSYSCISPRPAPARGASMPSGTELG